MTVVEKIVIIVMECIIYVGQIVLFIIGFNHFPVDIYPCVFWFAFCVFEAIISIIFLKEFKKTFFIMEKFKILNEIKSSFTPSLQKLNSRDGKSIFTAFLEVIENLK